MSEPKPKLVAWAPLAEILASIAVVLSLIYLAAEVRQNTRAIEGTAFQELIHATDAALLAVAGDPTLAEIIVRGDADYTTLSSPELLRYESTWHLHTPVLSSAFVDFADSC